MTNECGQEGGDTLHLSGEKQRGEEECFVVAEIIASGRTKVWNKNNYTTERKKRARARDESRWLWHDSLSFTRRRRRRRRSKLEPNVDDEFSSTNVVPCLFGEFIRRKCWGQTSDLITDHPVKQTRPETERLTRAIAAKQPDQYRPTAT